MKKPFTGLHFELTNKCNLRCAHCYNVEYLNSNNADLSTEIIKETIDKSLRIGVRDIGFSGGEPFMREDIFELIEYSKQHPIHILSNGMFINNKVIEKLNKIENLIIEFRISLDGLKSHEKIRGVSYRAALRGIKLLLENGYVTSVNTMITDDNIDELFEMYQLFKEIKLDRWRLDFVFKQGNAKLNNFDFSCNNEQLEIIKKLVATHITEKPCFEMDISKIYRSAVLDGAHAIYYDLDSRPCSYQGALTVRPNGDICYCPSLDISYGNIQSEDFNSILQNPEWDNIYRLSIKNLNKKCRECIYLKYCGGGCRADSYYISNDLYSYSPLTCRLIEFQVNHILPLIKTKMAEPFIL